METRLVELKPEVLASIMGTGGNAIMPFAREIFVINVNVAGTSYCNEIDDIAPKLIPQTLLKMRRDPNNEVDDYAIGLYYESTRIGWIPMDDNLVIARLMDAGKSFICKVVSVKNLGSWKKINVSVYMID